MEEAKKTIVAIDDVEYTFEEMTTDQQVWINQIADLDKKISSTKFHLDQLNVGRDAFFNMLKTSLKES